MATSSHPNDYERSDAEPRLLASLAIGLAVFLVLTPFVLGAAYPWATRRESPRGLPQPPAPRLEIKPSESLAVLRAREERALAGYGWIDRERGVARIPVDRAAALLAQRGLSGWPSQAAGMK